MGDGGRPCEQAHVRWDVGGCQPPFGAPGGEGQQSSQGGPTRDQLGGEDQLLVHVLGVVCLVEDELSGPPTQLLAGLPRRTEDLRTFAPDVSSVRMGS